jgi:tetratricopeptide (TPR) repeat protein
MAKPGLPTAKIFLHSLLRSMTMQTEPNPEKKFIPALLPWILAGIALIIYLVTLNPWVTFGSLGNAARAVGYLRTPSLINPVYVIVTFPLTLLPASWVPLALNLFSAVCAALSVGLLARCVALLPHDRTEEQRVRCHSAFSILTSRTAWLPPVFAAVLLGLQLTFWEDATAASIEMFDLLLFAYLVRSLLEFRIQENDTWLVRASFVYGAAMTNNWAMIAFFPLFLAALIWLKGYTFFNGRFLLRMFVAGSIGLLFYLILPLVEVIHGHNGISFWQALKANLVGQKTYLMALPFNKSALFMGDPPLWVLALPSLVPLLMLSVRWPSFFGDTSRLGILMSRWIFHFFHAFLLVFCTYVALDPKLSPRNYLPQLYTSGLHLLTFYFLGALSVGYFAGYFLVVFGMKPPKRQAWVFKDYPGLIKYPALGLAWGMAIFALFGLVYRNLPQIRVTNGSIYKDFAELSKQNLPGSDVLVLSDDPRRSFLIDASRKLEGTNAPVFVDTALLKDPMYHAQLLKEHPGRWLKTPAVVEKQPVDDLVLIGILDFLSHSNSIYYANPSFGYYFEWFYPTPKGMVYELNRYPTNSVFPPALTAQVIEQNEAFWHSAAPRIEKLAKAIAAARELGWADALFARLHLPTEPNKDATAVGGYYSRFLNYWGVQLQRQNKLKEAANRFEQAIRMNPDNLVARINLEANGVLQAGQTSAVSLSKDIERAFGEHQNLSQVLNANGPFDSATFCFQQGQEFARGNNFLQAIQQFQRVTELAPGNLTAHLALVQLYSRVRMPEKGLEIIQRIRAQPAKFSVGRSNVLDLTSTEAMAHLAASNPEKADEAFRKLAQQFPDTDIRSAAGQMFLNTGHFTNAVAWFNEILKGAPNDPNALAGKGFTLLQMRQVDQAETVFQKLAQIQENEELLGSIAQWFINAGYPTNALPWLDRQLKKSPGNANALVNKGFAWLQAKQYSNAIPVLSEALKQLDRKDDTQIFYTALLNRAIAHLQAGNLDKAKADYEDIVENFPAAYQVQYGLAEVALRQKDTNTAIKHFQLYLTNAPANTTEAQEVQERLKGFTKAGK